MAVNFVLIFYSKHSRDYLRVEGVVAKEIKPLKDECCEKYKKGKRCKRCPCFDLL
ncbi:hypothetical protein BH23BAC2_BH23BAC2_23780 [soil metagenome]